MFFQPQSTSIRSARTRRQSPQLRLVES